MENPIKAPRLDRPVSVHTPRAFREQDAAAYTGMSASYLRNTRSADAKALAADPEAPIRGPRWTAIGGAIRYLREDLDAWLESQRVDPGHGDPVVAERAEVEV